MTEEQFLQIFYRTVDPQNLFNGTPVPAGTTLLYKVCGGDGPKFEEACRLMNLFVTEALVMHKESNES